MLTSLAATVALLALPGSRHAVVANLRCEYRENPLGIDAVTPRLSWTMEVRGPGAPARGLRQTAYRVLVASRPELLARSVGDLWDSGRVSTEQSAQVEYAGRPLHSRARCHWKVRVWDQVGAALPWSSPARWSMGLLHPGDWQARWIGLGQSRVAEPPRAPVAPGRLRILSAAYQAVSGAPSRDVTGLLAARAHDGTLLVVARNEELGGDPADGVPKRLVVDYELAGRRETRTVAENDQLSINLDMAAAEEEAWSRPKYLRRAFSLRGTVRRAVVCATALGLYELRINGRRVGDQLLAPEWTDYRRRVQYQTRDVTALLRRGANAMGAVLTNGWYCGAWQHWEKRLRAIYGSEPSLRVQLEIEFADGRRETVVTDARWRGTTDGPLRFAGIYEGTTYDARREMPGWDAPGFDDGRWSGAVERGAELNVGRPVWQRGEPIRATRTLRPVAVLEPKPGVYVFAFDQNLVGHCRFTFRGKPGDTIELQHGEMRNLDGTVFLGNLLVVSSHRIQLDRYTFRTDAEETFEPTFTYHGFQFVEVRGLRAKPGPSSLVGVVANSDCPEVGQFACSDPLLTRLAQNILWSQRGNYMGVPTDCPQRNERCGYTGDAQFFMRAAVYNMDVASFFSRWLVDLCGDSQMPDGHFADHAPTFGPGDGPNVGWSDAGIICPYEIYRTYGDTRVIREHYPAMKRCLEWLTRNSRDGLFTGRVGNGDWLSTGGGASDEVIGTAYAAFDYRLMAEMADAIGEAGDAAGFRARAAVMGQSFARACIDADGSIRGSSQTGYALAFTMGLVPPALKERMIVRFADEVRRLDWHPRTGFIGTPRLLPALHLAGRDEDAYRLLLNRTAPSWLYPVSVGATTIWEQWKAWDGRNPQGGMNSLNHYAFGAVGEYLFGMVGGIQPGAPGYARIRIEPVIRPGLTWARTAYRSIRGRIVSSWRREGKRLILEVTIPANATATVCVPSADPKTLTEGGRPVGEAEGLTLLRAERGAVVLSVASGAYRFVSDFPGLAR